MKNKKSEPPLTRSEFLKEISKLATKEEVSKLALEIVKMQTEIKDVEKRLDTRITTEISKVLNAIDAFAQKAENYDRKALFHDSRINDHEERIVKLEKIVSK